MTRSEYVIVLFGCDDVTVFCVELEPAEAALLRRLAEISCEVARKDCQPTLYIDTFDITDIDKVVSLDEQFCPRPAAISARPRLRLADGVDRGQAGRDRRLGRGGGMRAEPVDDPVPGVAGEDRPR